MELLRMVMARRAGCGAAAAAAANILSENVSAVAASPLTLEARSIRLDDASLALPEIQAVAPCPPLLQSRRTNPLSADEFVASSLWRAAPLQLRLPREVCGTTTASSPVPVVGRVRRTCTAAGSPSMAQRDPRQGAAHRDYLLSLRLWIVRPLLTIAMGTILLRGAVVGTSAGRPRAGVPPIG